MCYSRELSIKDDKIVGYTYSLGADTWNQCCLGLAFAKYEIIIITTFYEEVYLPYKIVLSGLTRIQQLWIECDKINLCRWSQIKQKFKA